MPGERATFTATDSPEEFLACQRLASALLPSARLRALLEVSGGSPIQALHTPTTDLIRPRIGLTEKQIARLKDAASEQLPARLLDQARGMGASVVTFYDPAYPANMLPLSDSPPLLFVRGTLQPDDRFSIAIVGSRRATLYGREQADRFARVLAERGLSIISGGASGIDTCAHQGTLAVGGRTVAVLGCGIDVTYPAMNRSLFAQIVERGGALISEFPMGTKPEPWRFPARNRIIAGMSRATIVIETPEDSGALITARNAAEYGREVWVVPGPVDSGRSRGGHKLVQDGANLADLPEDILEGLGLPVQPVTAPTHPRPREAVHSTQPALPVDEPLPAAPAPATPPMPSNLTPDERALLAHFDLSPRHLDQASSAAGLSAAQATVAATLLEMKSLIRRQPGNLFVRNL